MTRVCKPRECPREEQAESFKVICKKAASDFVFNANRMKFLSLAVDSPYIFFKEILSDLIKDWSTYFFGDQFLDLIDLACDNVLILSSILRRNLIFITLGS